VPCTDRMLYDFVQLLERLRVFGAHRLLMLAAWIGPLQRAKHGPRHRDRSASVVLFTDKVELTLRLRVTGKAVHAEAVLTSAKSRDSTGSIGPNSAPRPSGVFRDSPATLFRPLSQSTVLAQTFRQPLNPLMQRREPRPRIYRLGSGRAYPINKAHSRLLFFQPIAPGAEAVDLVEQPIEQVHRSKAVSR